MTLKLLIFVLMLPSLLLSGNLCNLGTPIIQTNSSGTVTSIRQFVFSGMTQAEEYDGTNITEPVKRFFGQGFIQYSGTNNATATLYYYTRDHLGSIRELLSSTGTVVTRLDYDPYGRTTVVSGTVKPDFAFDGMY